MVKQTQTIRRLIADELLECVDHFVGLALKGLTVRNDKMSSCLYSQRFVLCL